MMKIKKLKNISDKDKKLINDSDIIILSSYWSNKDLDELEEVIKILEKLDKKVILTSNSPVFKVIFF